MSKRRGRERELSSRPAIADVRESADGVEAALNQIPELAGLQDEIKQGVDRWVMKMDRAGDSSFDRFESQALKETFDIPHDLQLVPYSDQLIQQSGDDAETAELWHQLQQRVAQKRQLKRRLAAVRRLELAWEAQRASFEQVANLYKPEDVEAILQKARHLHETLRAGLSTDYALASAGRVENAIFDLEDDRSKNLHHRKVINTVSVNDLQRLSSVLCT
mmetsp:Transcript_15355/g.46772  ORF Transcript_15355/g.46772 Transcript_15355/m.46772 type:complete len:219 (-) Transcript_15355:274-930(-)